MNKKKLLLLGISLLGMVLFALYYLPGMGVAFGGGMLALVLVHELGHVIAMRQKGLEIHSILFIPFVGAVITTPKLEDRNTEAYVGFGGPLLGTLASLAIAVPFFFTNDDFWIELAFFGLILNLFNMIPLSPLDGGRIVQAAHGKFKYLGAGILLAFTLLLREPGMLFIWMGVILFSSHPIPMRQRFCLSFAIWIVMLAFTCLGISRHVLGSWAAVAAGTFLLRPGIMLFVTEKPECREMSFADMESELQDTRPLCLPRQRIGWFLAWLLLTATLIAGTIAALWILFRK